MSVDMSLIDPTAVARILGGDSAALAALLAAVEAGIPPSADEPGQLNDADTLARALITLTPAEPSADLATQLRHHLQGQKIKLAPSLKARLLLLQTLVGALEEKSPLDDSLRPELERLRGPLLATGLRDLNLLTNPDHDLRRFITELFQSGSYWYPQSGKEGAVFYDALVQAVDAITLAARSEPPTSFSAAVGVFSELVAKQQTRARMMEQRCADSELGMAKIHRAQAQVVTLLESLNGCALPETVLQFVRSTLKGELQFILINHTETDSAWQSWSAIIKRLPQVFPVLVPEADKPIEPDLPNRQQLYRDVQIIVGLLDEHVTVSSTNQQAYDDGVEELRERLFEKLRGVNVPLFEFTPLSMPDELSLVGAAVSPSLLKKVANLKVGDWFLFHNSDDQLLRCKLLLRPPEIAQLLFVNRSGHRVLQKSVQDFSACLATRIARPLIVEAVFSEVLAATLEKMQQLAEKNQALINNAKKSEPVTKDIPAVVDAPTPVALSPASDRKSAAQKALQEARVLARLRVRRERQRALATQVPAVAASAPLDDEERYQQVQQQVENLNIGAWLDLPDAGRASRQRCKLVAIMRSTDTFILTNRSGVKVAEYGRAELVELLFTGAAEVRSSGDDFEGQLSKVVLTLRRDLS